jgi:hypothetical protein
VSTTSTAAYLPQTLSPEAVSVAIENRLGEHVATFPRAKNWKRIIAGAFLTAFLFLIGLVVFASSPDNLPVFLLMTLCAVGFFGFVVYLASQSHVFSKKAAARPYQSFANGFIEMGKEGPAAYRWDQMVTVFQEITTTYVNGVNTGTNYVYRITMADGRKIKLHSNNTNMAAFGPLIQRYVAEAQVPRMIEALRAGQQIPFGDVMVTPTGVVTRKGEVPWTEITSVRLQRGYAYIDRAGKRMAFFTRQCKLIPNLPSFLTLVEEGRVKGGRF